MAFFDFLDDSSGISRLFARDQVRYGPVRELRRNIMRGPSGFSEGERELMAAFVSRLNQCQFCAQAHAVRATERGFDIAVLEGLVADIDTAVISERLKPVFRFIEKLTVEPARMVEADVQAVLAAGWDETALVDAIVLCGYFNMVNRIADGHGLEAVPAERLRETETDAS